MFWSVLEKKQDDRFTTKARKLLEGIEINEDDGPAPEFFVEKARQTKFDCACGNHNDILGRFGYCSACGTRNGVTMFEDVTMFENDVDAIRTALNSASSALKETADAFVTVGRNCARQLCRFVLMTAARRVK